MTEEKKVNIDYRDPDTLRGFISENGKILSTRYTTVSYTHLTLPTICSV